MIVNNPKYNSLPEQVEQNRKDIEEIKSSHLIDVDDELSTQSTNAVQNKVITEALNTEEFERKQTDENLDNNKLDKTTSNNVLYATNGSGEQTTVPYGTSEDVQGTIVQRDENCDVLVPDTPTDDNGATSKIYVDGLNNKGYLIMDTYNGNDDTTYSGTSQSDMANIFFNTPRQITTKGRPLKIDMSIFAKYSGGSCFIEILIDGQIAGGFMLTNSDFMWVSLSVIITNISAGTHTIQFKEWGNNNASLTLHAYNTSYLTAYEI